jgi:hypothetical protein
VFPSPELRSVLESEVLGSSREQRAERAVATADPHT